MKNDTKKPMNELQKELMYTVGYAFIFIVKYCILFFGIWMIGNALAGGMTAVIMEQLPTFCEQLK